jgi:hypothetical protein
MKPGAESLKAWQILVVFFSAVTLGTHQFIRESLPDHRWLIMPTEVMLDLVIALRVVPVAIIFILDRLIAARFSSRILNTYRVAIMSLALLLIMRQLELYSPTDEVASALRQFSPVLLNVVLVAIGLLAIWFTVRFSLATARGFMYLALPAALLTLLLALYHFRANDVYAQYDASEVRNHSSDSAPVVIVIFDMLAYEALVQPDGRVDPIRFPNFSKLSDESLFLDNATSNHFGTYYTVRYFIESVLRLNSEYNVRLYEQTPWIEEEYSQKCGTEITCRGARYVTLSEKRDFESRLIIDALGRLLPGSLNVQDPKDMPGFHMLSTDVFRSMIGDITTEDSKGTVFLLHSHLPHDPFVFSADGTARAQGERFDYRSSSVPDDETYNTLWQHYLAQIQYTDRLLGELLERLGEQGLYDSMTLIVTSDHGLRSAYPEGEATIPVESTLTRIPVFIRSPGLPHGPTDIDYQHVDFAPTLYDLLGREDLVAPPDPSNLPVPAATSIFAPSRPNRVKEFFVTTRQHSWRWISDDESSSWALQEIIGSAASLGGEPGVDEP